MSDLPNRAASSSVPRSERVLSFAVPILMLLPPFLGMLQAVGHSVWRADSLTTVAILVGIGALCGSLVWRGGMLRVIVLATLLTIAIDLLLKGSASRDSLFRLLTTSGISAEPLVSAATFAISFIICWLLQRHLLQILATSFGVILVTTILLPAESSAGPRRTVSTSVTANGSGPLVLHLILDEHIGLEGIPADAPGAEDFRRMLLSFYQEFGFRVYERSYTVYAETRESLPNLVNFSTLDTKGVFLVPPRSLNHPPFTLTRNALFDQLAQRGYRIHVYQSDFMDFCSGSQAAWTDCYVYPFWGIDPPGDPIALGGRVRLLLSVYVKDSFVYHTARDTLYKRLRRIFPDLVAWDWERVSSGSLTTIAALRQLREDLTRASAGHAYFAHLLMPHSPYVYDTACRVRHPADWGGSPDQNLYSLAFDQTSCLYKELRALFEQLQDAGQLDDAVIFVHGDHGVRIGAGSSDASTRQDHLDLFSTLYAVKGPGIEPGLERSRRSVNELVTEYWTGPSAVHGEPFVLLPESMWDMKLQRRRLSDIGMDPVPPQ
ncbi:MAG: sulfatase-like hydrolase/transferase [Vicinamibacterales bacterium]